MFSWDLPTYARSWLELTHNYAYGRKGPDGKEDLHDQTKLNIQQKQNDRIEQTNEKSKPMKAVIQLPRSFCIRSSTSINSK